MKQVAATVAGAPCSGTAELREDKPRIHDGCTGEPGGVQKELGIQKHGFHEDHRPGLAHGTTGDKQGAILRPRPKALSVIGQRARGKGAGGRPIDGNRATYLDVQSNTGKRAPAARRP